MYILLLYIIYTYILLMHLCRPLPNHGLVEDYIKAYYLSESDLESWLIQHTVCYHSDHEVLIM